MKKLYISTYKNFPFIVFWVMFLITTHTNAQQNDLVLKAQEIIYSNPDESLKITEHLLKTAQQPQEKAILNLLMTKSYIVKGNFDKATIYAFDNTNFLNDVSKNTQIELNIIRAELLRNLYLDKQARRYLQKASELITDYTLNINERDSLQSLIALEQINLHLDRLENTEAILLIDSAEKRFKNFLKNNKTEKRNFYLAKGRAYSNLTKYDSAAVYFNKTFALIDSSKVNDLYQKAIIYKELGYLLLQKKEFSECEETLFIASRFAEIIDNPKLLMTINKNLAINYLASNKKVQHKVYNDKYLALGNQSELAEQEAVNSFYTIYSNQEETSLKIEEQKYQNYLQLLLAAILLILIISIYIILKSESRKKRLKEIIKYLEISRNNYIKTKPVKKSTTKSIVIPEETEDAILTKLKKFEASNKFLNKDMSLALLAGQFETNTKYLSEIINRNYNDNFNTFINKLRINYIIEKLKTDPNYINYKISFLADESGYSSHSSFATVFKSIIGMSPVTFIMLIQEERNELKPEKLVQ